jgi:hypothetical protein
MLRRKTNDRTLDPKERFEIQITEVKVNSTVVVLGTGNPVVPAFNYNRSVILSPRVMEYGSQESFDLTKALALAKSICPA